MKPLLVLAIVLAALPDAAVAQQAVPSPVSRADVAGTIGWLSGYKGDRQMDSWDDWYNSGLYVSGVGGWYWTDHHKTEVEAGVTNAIRFNAYRSTVINGGQGWGNSNFKLTIARVAIGQHYQFLRNAWVHPHVGGGLDLTWERTTEHAEPILVYTPSTGARELRPAATFGPTTTLRVRPYVETGFKAYASRRAFFRGDLRMLVHGGIDEVVLRCGFGIDF